MDMCPNYGGYYKGGPFGRRPGALAESALFALASCSYCGAREGEWVSLSHERDGVFSCERCR
jgi:hypothetical protein